jgi:UDP-3-O-[3-hydroxymyristoyl] glucosamine N-acyltransferase
MGDQEEELTMNLLENETVGPRILTVGEVAEIVGGRMEGDGSLEVHGIAPLEQATESELGFLTQRRYLRYLPESRARAVLVSEALAQEVAEIPGRVIVEEPHGALPPLLAYFYPSEPPVPDIHPTAVLGSGVTLGEKISVGPYAVLEAGASVGNRVRVGAHAVVGAGSVVGDDSVLHPHVVLYPGTRLGARVIVHSGARLGVDGFGFVPGAEGHQKVPQVGACVVEDDVEIGANTCIDRGSIGRTVVGRGTKLDNLIHLAHNVQVGEEVLMAAMVGIAGSTRIGKGAMFGGQAGLIGHLEIGAGAKIAAQAGISSDVPPGETMFGYPARNNREYLRAMGQLFKLPKTLRRLDDLEDRLQTLEDREGKDNNR